MITSIESYSEWRKGELETNSSGTGAVVAGAVLTATGVGSIAGLPLLAWGIYKKVKNSDAKHEIETIAARLDRKIKEAKENKDDLTASPIVRDLKRLRSYAEENDMSLEVEKCNDMLDEIKKHATK